MNKEELNDIKNKVKELQDKNYWINDISNILGLRKIIVELSDEGYSYTEISNLIGVPEGFIQGVVSLNKTIKRHKQRSKEVKS